MANVAVKKTADSVFRPPSCSFWNGMAPLFCAPHYKPSPEVIFSKISLGVKQLSDPPMLLVVFWGCSFADERVT